MRVLRAKFVRRCLRFYKIIFGINPPYHIILDGNFIHTGLKYKVDIEHRLCGLLQVQNVVLYILKSSLDELRQVGQKAEAALNWALNCCTLIDDTKFPGTNPIERAIKVVEQAQKGSTPKFYFFATQDVEMRAALDRIPGVPIIFFNKVTLVLGNISKASDDFTSKVEDIKTSISSSEENALRKLKSIDSAAVVSRPEKVTEVEGIAVVSRLKKKPNAPNPLSSMGAKDDSVRSKKKKNNKFRRQN